MNLSLLDIISSLAIGLLIALMASVKNIRLKATIYTLPIPITIALIATGGKIESSNIIGLMLICGFIGMTMLLHNRLKLHVAISDVVAALAYIGVGYILVRTISISFLSIVAIYVSLWGMLISWYHRHPVQENATTPAIVPPALKGVGVSAISLLLFSIKDTLAGVVVTFPYSGVFAVLEAKDNLATFLRVVIRNSLAILALFIAMYPLQQHIHVAFNLVIGWSAYLIVLWIVRRIHV